MQDTFETETEAKPPRRRRESTFRFIVGIILVVLGIGIFLEQISGFDLGFVPLLVGAGLLAGWSQNRSRGLLIAGSIVSGFGVGSVLAPLVIQDLQHAVELLSLAGGFALISILSRRKPTWPWIVAGTLSLVAVADVADVSQFVPLPVVRLGLPSVVVLAGLVLLMRDRLSRRSQLVLFAVLAIAGLILNGARERSPGTPPVPRVEGRTVTLVEELSEHANYLVVGARGATVIVKEGPPAARLVSTAEPSQRRATRSEPDHLGASDGPGLALIVVAGGPPQADRVLTIWVRDGTSLEIEGTAGEVAVTGADLESVEVVTTSGDIVIESAAKHIVVSSASGDVSVRPISGAAVTIKTNSGDVELLMSSSLKMRTLLSSESGNVLTPDGRYQPTYSAEGVDGSLDVTSKFGDITMTAIPTL